MKRLLILHHWGGLGGAGLSLLHIIRSIDNTLYQVFVLCPKYPNEMINELENENCTVIPLEQPPAIFNHYNGGIKYAFSFSTFNNVLRIAKDKKRIINYINNVSPDILIVNSMTLFWVGKYASKMGLKTICFHRETYQNGLVGFRTSIIKLGLSKWFERVAFISKFDLLKTGNILAEKQLIYDRVDLNIYTSTTSKEAREKLDLIQDEKYILFVGGISDLKGSSVVIDAMKYLKNKKVKLLFVGEVESIDDLVVKESRSIKHLINSIIGSNTKTNLYKSIIKNNLIDQIIFRKRSAQPELFYSACNLIVFPSTIAHQSRPIYEAGVARIPIIITEFAETREFASNGITAITFENKNSQELAYKIEQVLNGNIKTDEIVENNYQQSIKFHNLDNLKNDIAKLLNFNTP